MFEIRGAYLRSAFGRRMFVLFLVAALIPAALMAILTYQTVAGTLSRRAHAEMAGYGKTYGLGLVSRLRVAAGLLRESGGDPTKFASLSGAATDPEERIFRSVQAAGDRTGAPQVLSLPDNPIVQFEARARRNDPARGGFLLQIVPAADGTEPTLALAVLPDGSANPKRPIVGVIEPGYAFGGESYLPPDTDLCVFDARQTRIYCSEPRLEPQARWIAADASGTTGAPGLAGDTDFGVWILHGTDEFPRMPWTFVSMRPTQHGVLANQSIGRTYVEVALAGFLLVALLSLAQIRRNLGPLDALMRGTRRLAAGKFDGPIQTARTDEFGLLAQSFNNMAEMIQDRVEVMRILASIDQEILTHAPVDRIIERVLQRMQHLVPGSVPAISRSPAASTGGREVTIWCLSDGQLNVATRPMVQGEESWLAQSGEPTYVERVAAAGSALASRLFASDAQRCVLLAVPTPGRTRVTVGLGLGAGLDPGTTELGQIAELGKRVCVALEAAEHERQLRFEARQDSLTRLPNRLRTIELVDERVAPAQRQAVPFAVLFVDLDRFKQVNDGLGHEAGDILLAEAADRIRGCLGDGEVVARWGGDEFIVLSAVEATAEQVKALAERIIAAIAKVFRIWTADAYVGASIGISFFPADGATRDVLVRNADRAMFYAKKGGRGRLAFYDPAMSRTAADLLTLEADLRRALVAGEMSVHFQPRVRLTDEQLVGAEALVRWKHPVRGMVPPAHFVGLAEQIGVIGTLGRTVLTQTCSRVADWKRRGVGVDRVSVNVSAQEFRNPRLVEEIRAGVRAAGLTPADIELEVTESAFIDDIMAARRILGEFRDAGFRTALDDFGTGFSSMSHLQSLPLDVLKIDGRFVMDLEKKADSRAIALAIITMGHALGMRVVAEGVETPEQARMLREWGCDEAQGYLYARPLPAEDFERFCSERKPAEVV